MSEIEIERRLQLHILNLCLAVVGKQEGDVSLCKQNIIREVKKMIERLRAELNSDRPLGQNWPNAYYEMKAKNGRLRAVLQDALTAIEERWGAVGSPPHLLEQIREALGDETK
jgi:hypothetical protein